MPTIAVNLFETSVDSLDHPDVRYFKNVLDQLATDCGGALQEHDIHQGTVVFTVDNEEAVEEKPWPISNAPASRSKITRPASEAAFRWGSFSRRTKRS